MKKKLLSFILAICLIMPCAFVLSACGNNPPPENPHVHEWVEGDWKNNATEHWHWCKGCDEKKDKGNHDGDVCSICGYDANHTHEYGSTYLKDSDGHWQKCIYCDNTTTKENHNYNGNSCLTCGYETTGNQPSLPVVSNVRDLEVITMPTNDGGYVTLVKLPDGKNMLLGAGADSFSSELSIDNLLMNMHNITTIDYFILTSISDLRIGGADSIFEYYEVKEFYYSTFGSAITASSSYNLALEKAQTETGCISKNIEENNCDIDYYFKDAQGNTYNYKIDLMLPFNFSQATSERDVSVVVSITYQNKTVLVAGDATETNIDGYCTKYGTTKNVDALVAFYSPGECNAIAGSANRGTNYLDKISLENGDICIIGANNGTSDITNLYSKIGHLGDNVHTLTYEQNKINLSTITITNQGELLYQ